MTTPLLKQYRLNLFIPGQPAPQGSKRHLGRGIMIESSKNVGPWRERIALAAHNYAIKTDIPLPFRDQPLALTLKFVMPRPASTPKTRRTPPAIKRPDIDKLSRSVLDALTGIIYTDDAAVIRLEAHKRIAEPNESPGVHIAVQVLL